MATIFSYVGFVTKNYCKNVSVYDRQMVRETFKGPIFPILLKNKDAIFKELQCLECTETSCTWKLFLQEKLHNKLLRHVVVENIINIFKKFCFINWKPVFIFNISAKLLFVLLIITF